LTGPCPRIATHRAGLARRPPDDSSATSAGGIQSAIRRLSSSISYILKLVFEWVPRKARANEDDTVCPLMMRLRSFSTAMGSTAQTYNIQPRSHGSCDWVERQTNVF